MRYHAGVGRLLRRLGDVLRGRGTGTVRIGRYRILRRLAEGGMGEIFLARAVGRSGFEKVVVLKRIRQQSLGDREAVNMFLDEARLMATLNHPNIVQVYDFGTARGAPFFTMEYVHGEDLGRLMKAAATIGRPLPLEVAIGIIADAAAGLHHAHEKRGRDGRALQIVHRDISPSNVLVSYDGGVKVADFGIAKWTRRETETRYGALKGKIAYMSPEQCRSEALDSRSDVFGLGILLFELVTGQRLYQGTSDFAILQQVVTRDAPAPSSLRPHCPPEIDRIVLRALARDPARRFSSARELQLALEEFARQERLPISSVSRAAEMEILFGGKIVAWREAVQAGRSLPEHLADFGTEATSAEQGDSGAPTADRRTGTLPERPGQVTAQGFDTTGSPGRHAERTRALWLRAGAVVLLAAGISAILMRQQSRTPDATTASTRAEMPRPVVEPLPQPPAQQTTAAPAQPSVPPDTDARPARTHRSRSRASDTSPRPAPGKKWDPDSVLLP